MEPATFQRGQIQALERRKSWRSKCFNNEHDEKNVLIRRWHDEENYSRGLDQIKRWKITKISMKNKWFNAYAVIIYSIYLYLNSYILTLAIF
jgi:hypothetical protein